MDRMPLWKKKRVFQKLVAGWGCWYPNGIMIFEDVLLPVVFAAQAIWFINRNRQELDGPAVVRHIIFTTFCCLGCLLFIHGVAFDRWVFGKEIHKGDPQELIAGALPLI